MTESKLAPMRERLHCPRLSLAIYREVAAHLCQVAGVTVELQPQTSEQFDYHASQIAALHISYPADTRDRLDQILNYYAERHGGWQRQPLPTPAVD